MDSLTALVFFTVVATLSERYVAGMSWEQVAATRVGMVPVMLLTGRPYGLWRDLVFRRLAGRAGLLVDTAAFVSFQLPVYAVILALAGAELVQMVAALASATVGMLALSRPYGLVLDAARRVAGTAPAT